MPAIDEASDGCRWSVHADVEGDSSDGRLERWLEATANQPDPDADVSFGDDEATPGVRAPVLTCLAWSFRAERHLFARTDAARPASQFLFSRRDDTS